MWRSARGIYGGTTRTCLQRAAPRPSRELHRKSSIASVTPFLPPTARRPYSTDVRSSVEKLLTSRVSFRLANGLWLAVGATVLYYVWKKRGRSSPEHGLGGSAESRGKGNRFSQKVVLITGGAGDIGCATARAFAQEGAIVVLVDLPHTEEALRKTCVELGSQGAAKAFYTTADVTSEEQVKKMARFAIEKAGHIDCFFNNAGIQGELKPLHKQSEEGFLKVLQVNAYGVFLGMKYVAEAMMEGGSGGVIVNTASLAGLLGPPNMAAYAASKFAVMGMTSTAAKDFAPYGIRVCAIAPGLLEGRMWATQVQGQTDCLRQLEGKEGEATEEELQQTEKRMIAGTPMKRLGRLSEVASVVLFLCSDEASYLTGNVISIAGGRLL